MATIVKLSAALDIPDSFLFLNSPQRLEEGAVSFRRATKVPAYKRKAALAAGEIAGELHDIFNQYFEIVDPDIPDLSDCRSPEDAAETLRAYWGLGSGPAPNMVHLLESKGVFVTALTSDCREIDAFSFWRERRPFVVLNTVKSAERGRMDAAHELGHLVLHSMDPEAHSSKEQEAEANAFGAEFLVPGDELRNAGWRSPMLETILEHKKAWGVAATLFVCRLSDVGILTSWAYRSLMIELSQRGYRSGEPDGIERESSLFFGGAMRSLRQDGIRLSNISNQLELHPKDVREFLFGLTLA